MALELLNLRHGRILPQNQLILAKSMARANLPLMLRPQQRAHLRARIDGVQHRTRVGVPTFNGAVGGTASARQQASVEGTPRQGLDRSLVLGEGEARTNVNVGGVKVCISSIATGAVGGAAAGHGVPQTEQIFVSSRGQGAAFIVPRLKKRKPRVTLKRFKLKLALQWIN